MRLSPVQIFHKHLPALSIEYCLDLWRRYPFQLKLRHPRETKLGDFCAHRGLGSVITINSDLYPYMFLLTYIHEFSHHAVFLVYGPRTEAHGKEWKLAFKTFMGPVLDMPIFPPDLKMCLQGHMANPKATTFSDPKLTALLRKYDPAAQHQILLSALKPGDFFKLKGKRYRKDKVQRTRVLCTEMTTGKVYLVPKDYAVDPA